MNTIERVDGVRLPDGLKYVIAYREACPPIHIVWDDRPPLPRGEVRAERRETTSLCGLLIVTCCSERWGTIGAETDWPASATSGICSACVEAKPRVT